MLLLIRYLGEVEVKEWHGAGVAVRGLDVPLVWHEVVLVEKLGALGGARDQPLRLADVPLDYVAHIGVELLARQLQTLVRLELLLAQLGQSVDFLPAQLHEHSFALDITLFFSGLTRQIGIVSLVADHVELILSSLFSALLELLRLRDHLQMLGLFLVVGTPPAELFLSVLGLIEHTLTCKIFHFMVLLDLLLISILHVK